MIEKALYAEVEESTSVLLDTDHEVLAGVGAFFYDNELEAE
ncbi:hypothetical protein ACGFZC_16300 [[Kitasatospora] papulosa]